MKKSIGAKTIIYPTPVLIVATYDKAGRANAMSVAWGGICCSAPPSVAISVREATYTYGNLIEKKAFTVNIPSESQVKEADYFGIVSGRDKNKFADAGLTPVKSKLVAAPYIKEFPLILECKVSHSFKIGLHTQFIGEILDIKADDSILDDKGLPDIKKVAPFLFDPANRNYYGIGELLGKAFSIGKNI